MVPKHPQYMSQYASMYLKLLFNIIEGSLKQK